MLQFAEEPKAVVILDENGQPLTAGDNERRFFEASWMHKYNGKYYFSYSTGDTHRLCYAIGDNPYGPFTYQGIPGQMVSVPSRQCAFRRTHLVAQPESMRTGIRRRREDYHH